MADWCLNRWANLHVPIGKGAMNAMELLIIIFVGMGTIVGAMFGALAGGIACLCFKRLGLGVLVGSVLLCAVVGAILGFIEAMHVSSNLPVC
jgi:hypothetical protein